MPNVMSRVADADFVLAVLVLWFLPIRSGRPVCVALYGICNTGITGTCMLLNGLFRKYEGRTESHEQLFFLHANWKQQTKESAVVDGTSCCVILECLVTSIACIT